MTQKCLGGCGATVVDPRKRCDPCGKEYRRLERRRLKDAGLCATCRQPHGGKEWRCQPCLAARREEYRARTRRECRDCGAKIGPYVTLCHDCKVKREKERQEAYRDRARASARCLVCASPVAAPYTRCEPCRIKYRTPTKPRSCRVCGIVIERPATRCEPCIEAAKPAPHVWRCRACDVEVSPRKQRCDACRTQAIRRRNELRRARRNARQQLMQQCRDCGKPSDGRRHCPTCRTRRSRANIELAKRKAPVSLWPCARCCHGIASTVSDSGWECGLMRAGTCAPWAGAKLWEAR